MSRKQFANVDLVAVALALLMFVPATVWSQSSIAGVVRDTTGAVLPGVTVEGSSPALIEKVRTVVTDGQGQYKIIDLRPGVYSVTFTLPGFSTVKRDGIELTANFTAPVNAELNVGTVEETVTVSGASPVVDVQSVLQQKVITDEVVEALPTARTMEQIAALVPGVVIGAGAQPSGQDVGGSMSEGQQKIAIHGGNWRDTQALIDGMPVNAMATLEQSGVYMDTGAIEEFSYEVGALSAETAAGGIRINMIPKSGGNQFAGTFFGAYTNGSLQANNFTEELRTRGLNAVNRMKTIWDVNTSVGGPIKRDAVWFFGSFRNWGNQERVAGMWFDTNPRDNVYTPDLTRQGIVDTWLIFGSGRFTWQASPKNRISVFFLKQDRCVCHRSLSSTTAPEAATRQSNPADELVQVKWSAPLSNRLLLEAGFMPYRFETVMDPQPEVTPDMLSITELSTGLRYRAASGYSEHTKNGGNRMWNYRAALAYVTGSHSLKVGMTLQRGTSQGFSQTNGDINLQFLNGVPRSVTVFTTPYIRREELNANLGVYAQDQWTIERLTLNAGVRFDYLHASVPEQHLPVVQFVGVRDFAPVPDVPKWTDLSPRLGASYDLFGTGKTALKVTVSRYVAGVLAGIASANNPINTSVNSATRTWTDDGDFIPQANELGPLSNASFGQVVIRTRYDEEFLKGFGKRGYQWETTAGIQQELMPGVSGNATYLRRSYGNFQATDNVLVNPTDYDPFCVTAPVDSRLPGGGGDQICGLFDINPSRFGQASDLVTFAKNFGEQYEYWQGVDLTLNARFPRSVLVSGGVSTGRRVFDNCDVIGKVDNPASTETIGITTLTVASPTQRFCHQTAPFQPQLKFNATFPLPGDFQASGTYQGIPGPQITARWVAPNALIRPSLNRDLAAGANGTAVVELIAPGTMYGERLHQVDFRLSKIVRIGRTRIQGNFDLYNALNANPVLALNTTFGPDWQKPSYVLPGRLFKFGAQVSF